MDIENSEVYALELFLFSGLARNTIRNTDLDAIMKLNGINSISYLLIDYV